MSASLKEGDEGGEQGDMSERSGGKQCCYSREHFSIMLLKVVALSVVFQIYFHNCFMCQFSKIQSCALESLENMKCWHLKDWSRKYVIVRYVEIYIWEENRVLYMFKREIDIESR